MARWEYECIRCKSKILGLEIAESHARFVLTQICSGIKSNLHQDNIVHITHDCNDGGVGMANLIGCSVDKPAGKKINAESPENAITTAVV